jgi:hypothetical protein
MITCTDEYLLSNAVGSQLQQRTQKQTGKTTDGRQGMGSSFIAATREKQTGNARIVTSTRQLRFNVLQGQQSAGMQATQNAHTGDATAQQLNSKQNSHSSSNSPWRL